MADDRNSDARPKLTLADIPVSEEQRMFGACVPNGLDEDVVRALYAVALAEEKTGAQDIIRYAQRHGIDQIALSDVYVPAVAHVIGEMWCEDYIGFAHVTIAVSRLQSLLRHLGPEWVADLQSTAETQSILLISPDTAQHTLGAVIVAGRLRRLGYSVRLALNPPRHALEKYYDRMTFDAVFISASQSESLEKLRVMIEMLRGLSAARIPIAVGGGLLTKYDDIAVALDADIATSNIDEAIEHCGLIRSDTRTTQRVTRT